MGIARCPAALLLLLLVGCGRSSPLPAPALQSVPVIDPGDPESIARWEASPYNFGDCKISVVKLRFLHGVLGDAAPKKAQAVALRVYGAKKSGIALEQQTAIDCLVRDEGAIHAAVRDAVYAHYKQSYAAYKQGLSAGAALFGGADEIEDVLPPIAAGNELDGLVEISTIYVHPPVNGSASLGVDFSVPWDEEHGIGLRWQDGKVTAIGTGHEAFPPPQRQ